MKNQRRQLQIAKALYAAYRVNADMVEWEALPRRIQVAWMAAGGHAVMAVPASTPEELPVSKWAGWEPSAKIEGLNDE
jgi:hypothetical protein